MTEKHRVKLIADPDDVIDNSRIIQEWMVIENNRMREENILKTAREEGRDEGKEANKLEVIKNMLYEGADYNFISKVTGKSIHEVKEIETLLNKSLTPNT